MFNLIVFITDQGMAGCQYYSCYHFGHSFPRRLYKYIQSTGHPPSTVLELPSGSSIFIDGYSGLSLQKVLSNPDCYLARLNDYLSRSTIDILSVDIGTNDLCAPEVTVSVLIGYVIEFIELLVSRKIRPKLLVFFSIIQRTRMTRSGQVNLQCFNHRAKQFNRFLGQALEQFPWVRMFSQNKINFPKYLNAEDGCHLTTTGMMKYIKGIRKMFGQCKALLDNQP